MRTLLTTTAIVLLTGGAAMAACQDRMQSFSDSYGVYADEQVRQTRSFEIRDTLRELRSAARTLSENGMEEACENVVDAVEAIHAAAPEPAPVAGNGNISRELKTEGEPAEAATDGQQTAEAARDKQADAKDDEIARSSATKDGEQTAETEGGPAEQMRDRRLMAFEAGTSNMLLDNLVGYNVYNLEDDFLGEIDGLVVDENDKPTHVVIGHGGFWGIGDKEAIIPAEMLAYSQSEDVFYLDVTEEQLSNAPDYDLKDGAWVQDTDEASINKWWEDTGVKPAHKG